LKRLPFNITLAAKNYGFDNILPPGNAHPGSKLCMAILRRDNQEVEQLLAQPSLIFHQEDPDGWTPLIYSVYYNNPTARKMLFDLNASPEQPDYACRTPLMFAAIKNDTRLILELFQKGADIAAIDYRGKSALDFAVEYRNRESMALICQLAQNFRRK
jgi:ankyrin repeat protein